ncbi:MAG: hypothetical protein E7316_00295 [Clostridiales bacterium]|nr:hypothetical protein [Clostridiales bacterium]
MKDHVSASPFAALTPREQLERWICWQNQHPRENINTSKATMDKPDLTSFEASQKPTESRERMPVFHSQYDAVVRRIKKASQGAVLFQRCDCAASTTHPSSGRENAEK